MERLNVWLNEQRGRRRELAISLGITPGALSQWSQVPPKRAVAIEAITGISRHELCPEVFGPSPSRGPSREIAQQEVRRRKGRGA